MHPKLRRSTTPKHLACIALLDQGQSLVAKEHSTISHPEGLTRTEYLECCEIQKNMMSKD